MSNNNVVGSPEKMNSSKISETICGYAGSMRANIGWFMAEPNLHMQGILTAWALQAHTILISKVSFLGTSQSHQQAWPLMMLWKLEIV